jgi:hypothetical protein
MEIRISTPDAAPLTSMPPESLEPRMELKLGDYDGYDTSIVCGGRDDVTFAFTIWPVSAETLEALGDVMAKSGKIWLLGSRGPLLFDPMVLECQEHRRVRLEGGIVVDPWRSPTFGPTSLGLSDRLTRAKQKATRMAPFSREQRGNRTRNGPQVQVARHVSDDSAGA